MVPPAAPSLIDHVTATFLLPVTIAVNWSVAVALTADDAAVTLTVTAVTVTAIVDDSVLSATLVAITW
jgi:hypothetical protein